MEGKSDGQLLREHAEQGSETAFGEIVGRYTDLVYSAALRQVGSPDVARDIAQSVFTDLARKATSLVRKLKPETSLAGWLYRATRYAALTHLRNESHRRARERHAMEQLIPTSESAPDWEQVSPLLDDAMARLSDADREALLLRFFKDHDLRVVGAALGISDDAAQKRVTRSLEKLRKHLLRRGITTSGASLATAMSANAVQAAPAGLAATLTSASLASATTSTAVTTSLLELMAITKSQVGIITAVVIASLATPLIIQHQAQGKLRARNASLEQNADRLAELRAENQRLAGLLAQANSRAVSNERYTELMRFRGEVARLRREAQELSRPKVTPPTSRNEALASMAQRYSERISRLKQFLQTNPSESIPELQFLTETNWLWVAGQELPETEEGYQRAMSLARSFAEGDVAREILRPALQQYAQNNDGQFPSNVFQLKPYFKRPLDDAILERWQVLPAIKLVNLKEDLEKENWVITQKAPVNRAFDQRYVFSIKDAHLFAAAPPNHWDVAP